MHLYNYNNDENDNDNGNNCPYVKIIENINCSSGKKWPFIVVHLRGKAIFI